MNLWIELAVVFAALNSVLSLAYYAPLVNAMYRLEPSTRVRQGKRLPLADGFPLVVLGLAVVVMGVLAEPDELVDRPGRSGLAGRPWRTELLEKQCKSFSLPPLLS